MFLYFLLQIDLDTIDVSNLNRQFLFRKEHVGKPKSQVCNKVLMVYMYTLDTHRNMQKEIIVFSKIYFFSINKIKS